MKILIVEDEENVSSFVKQGLEENSYEIYIAEKSAAALDILQKHEIDLIILDIILPDMHGDVLCRQIREQYGNAFQIIMLTALNSTDQVVEGLNAGADDYLGKPFEFKELLARIQALSRRSDNSTTTNTYKYHDLEINDNKKEVTRGSTLLELTPKEYGLLIFLMNNKERVVNRQELLENVWGVDFDLGTNVVDVYVNYLRNKVDKGFDKKLIHTVKGMGYCLRLDKHEYKT